MKPGPTNAEVPDGNATSDFTQRVIQVRHDLRNPLGHIMGFAELLTDAARKDGHHDCSADLAFLNESTDRIVARVNASLNPEILSRDDRDLEILKGEICQFATDVVAATTRLTERVQTVPDERFRTDLGRIAGAAEKLKTMTSPALDSLRHSESSLSSLGSAAAAAAATVIRSAASVVQLRPAIRSWKDGTILVVDNDRAQQSFVAGLIAERGYAARGVDSAREALAMATSSEAIDLVLVDVTLKGEGGRHVLRAMKDNPQTQHVPVIMMAAEPDVPIAMACLAEGAEDFLPKPVHPTVLMARVKSALAKKNVHDQERAYLQRLQAEQDRAERLLLNILPVSVARRLKQGENVILDEIAEATIVLAKIMDLSRLRTAVEPRKLLGWLNELFGIFDYAAEKHGLIRIFSAPGSYIALAGLDRTRGDGVSAAAEMALSMQGALRDQPPLPAPMQFRIAVSTGAAIAGVVGGIRFGYSVWGPAMEEAERLVDGAPAAALVVSLPTAGRLAGGYQLQQRTGPAGSGTVTLLLGKTSPRLGK